MLVSSFTLFLIPFPLHTDSLPSNVDLLVRSDVAFPLISLIEYTFDLRISNPSSRLIGFSALVSSAPLMVLKVKLESRPALLRLSGTMLLFLSPYSSPILFVLD